MTYIPHQGDIIWLDFDPSSGTEIIKRRPAFVISKKIFTEHVGLAIVAPITSTVRGIKLEVALPKTLDTKGAVLVYQIRSLDIFSRNAKFIEKAPQIVIDEVCHIASVIIGK